MPRDTKSERVVKILMYLQETRGRKVHVVDVMKRLGLGENERINVQRDLKLLADLPGTHVRAVGSGRELGYHIPRESQLNFALDRPLERNDLFSFLLLSRLQQGMLKGGAGRIRVFEDLLEKGILQAAPGKKSDNPYSDMAARFGDLVMFGGEEVVQGPDPELVPTLFSALLGRRKLEIDYEGISDESLVRHIIEPWSLLVYRGEVYFVCPKGGNRTALYTYKLSRMNRARLLDENFATDHKLLKAFREKLGKGMGLYTDVNDKPVRIRLAFPWGHRLALREKRPHASHEIRLDKTSKRVIVSLNVPINEDLLEWVRKWGDRVEVLQPQALKNGLLVYADFIRETYGTGLTDDEDT